MTFNSTDNSEEISLSQDTRIIDDKKIEFGNGADVSIEYDEDGTDELRFAGAAAIFEQDVKLAGVDGALQFTNAGENSIKIPVNQASALIIEEDDNAYMTFNSTDCSEAITFNKAVAFSGGISNGGTIVGTTITANTSIVPDAEGGADKAQPPQNGVMLILQMIKRFSLEVARMLQ